MSPVSFRWLAAVVWLMTNRRWRAVSQAGTVLSEGRAAVEFVQFWSPMAPGAVLLEVFDAKNDRWRTVKFDCGD